MPLYKYIIEFWLHVVSVSIYIKAPSSPENTVNVLKSWFTFKGIVPQQIHKIKKKNIDSTNTVNYKGFQSARLCLECLDWQLTNVNLLCFYVH